MTSEVKWASSRQLRHCAESHRDSGRCVAFCGVSSRRAPGFESPRATYRQVSRLERAICRIRVGVERRPCGQRAVLPGLEIVIAKDASPLARRLARQFIADCVGKPDAG